MIEFIGFEEKRRRRKGGWLMRGDTRSLLHGIINLLMPLFIYDLASLLVAAISAARYEPWLAFWPMTVLL